MKILRWIKSVRILLLLGFTLAAHADTVFDLNATLTQTGVTNPGTGTLQGTLTFNTTTGAFDGLSLTFSNPGTSAFNTSYNLNYVFGGPTLNGTPTEFGISGYVAPYQASLFLFLPASAPLTGYAGGPICSLAYACISSQDGVTREDSGVSITGGSLTLPFVNASYTVNAGTLTAETPEPSSFVLMATGLGLVGLKRRLHPAQAARRT